jgi:hypothetical protein
MNANELAAATAQFDRENLSPPTPLRGEKLRRFRRAISRRGRPRIGKGSKAITVTLERGLLTRADRVARERHITRSQLIASALMAHFHAGDANE